MLPGFRFLFAAIVLSMSLLVFGLGTAALLRAAHQEFASTPSWRATPEPKFAQQNDAAPPVLAMLRVEPEPAPPEASESIPATVPAERSAEPPAIAPVPDEPEKIAALKPQDIAPPEAAKSEIPVPETSVPGEAPADTPVPVEQAQTATAEQVPPPADQAVAAAPEPAIAPSAADTGSAATKIATLGGPPVAIETQPPAKAAGAKADRSAIKKRLQARRAKERRRRAQRARAAAAHHQAADPFAQPTVTTRIR